MWWRFITFCFLVSFILFVVLNYLHDRPVVHFKFFKHGSNDVDSDQIIYERFKDNFLKERLVAFEFVEDNGTFVPEDADIEKVIQEMRDKINVHDPNSRKEAINYGKLFNHANKTDINESLNETIEEMINEFDTKNSDKNDEVELNKAEKNILNETELESPGTITESDPIENKTDVVKSLDKAVENMENTVIGENGTAISANDLENKEFDKTLSNNVLEISEVPNENGEKYNRTFSVIPVANEETISLRQ